MEGGGDVSAAGTRTKSVSIDKDLVEWVERQRKRRRFRSFSAAINEALRDLKEREERGGAAVANGHR